MTRQHCLLVFSRFSKSVYKKCKNIYIFIVCLFRKQFIIIIIIIKLRLNESVLADEARSRGYLKNVDYSKSFDRPIKIFHLRKLLRTFLMEWSYSSL